jgi:hypothetical protein
MTDSRVAAELPSAAFSGRPGWAVVSIRAMCPSTVKPGGFRGGYGWITTHSISWRAMVIACGSCFGPDNRARSFASVRR